MAAASVGRVAAARRHRRSCAAVSPYPGRVPRVRVAAAQLDLVVGDLDGNVGAHPRRLRAGRGRRLRPRGVPGARDHRLPARGPAAAARRSSRRRARRSRRSRPAPARRAAVVGFPEADRDLYNAAAVCADGRGAGRLPQAPAPELRGVRRAALLRAVDRRRPAVRRSRGVRVAVTICEDAWSPTGPIITQAAGGAELVVNINASPYYAGRLRERETMLATRAADASVPVVYVNLVGGQDELVFDGASMLFDESGQLVARAQQFDEDLLVVDVDVRPAFRRRLLDPRGRARAPPLPEVAVSEAQLGDAARRSRASSRCSTPVHEVYEALVLGTRDYVTQERLHRRAHRALGRHRLVARRRDRGRRARPRARHRRAHAVAVLERRQRHRRRGARREPRHPHDDRSRSSRRTPRSSTCSAEPFAGTEPGLAEENLQARIRGTILMTMSNKFGWLVLTTGNKSEMATGYATLYGDMAGGVRGDQGRPEDARVRARARPQRAGRARAHPRRRAREAAERRAAPRPEGLRLAARVRGARPDHRGLRRGRPARSPSSRPQGYDPDTVRRVARLVDRNEYKRRQAPPGRARVAQGVRQGPPAARSPTAGPASAPLRLDAP